MTLRYFSIAPMCVQACVRVCALKFIELKESPPKYTHSYLLRFPLFSIVVDANEFRIVNHVIATTPTAISDSGDVRYTPPH